MILMLCSADLLTPHGFCRFPNRPHGIQAHARLFLIKSAKKQSAIGAIIKRRAVCFETDKSEAVR